MKTLGILVHSAEGGGLCFTTACRHGQRLMGPHLHPDIVLSAVPMGRSMAGWHSGNHQSVVEHLRRGTEMLSDAGADFFICPDNTAHIVLETIIDDLPIPGIHIAQAVGREMRERGLGSAGLLGTKWTMEGGVYPRALASLGLRVAVPPSGHRRLVDRAIFDELCRGTFSRRTKEAFVRVIEGLAEGGADSVILGCTEIPLLIAQEDSPLPVLDTTRLLARQGVEFALGSVPLAVRSGWLSP